MKPSSNSAGLRRRIFYSDLTLVLAAASFSTSFILQRAALVNGIKPFIFNASRFGLSSILLLVLSPIIPESLKTIKPSENIGNVENPFHSTLKWGLLLGVLNFSGTTFQQWGISLTSASKCAFMTGFYVFFVPVITTCLSPNRNKLPLLVIAKTWLAVGVSITGLFLLSGASISEMSIGRGEAITLVGTLFWTAHVMVTDVAMNYVDTVSITFTQFITVMCLSLLSAVLFEASSISLEFIIANCHWIFFLSLSEGGGFFLTAIGQRYSPPSHVAFIFSLESVFTSLGGYTFLNERLTNRDLLGCSLLISSTIFSQLYIFNHNNAGSSNPHTVGNADTECGGEDEEDSLCLKRTSSAMKLSTQDSAFVVKRKKVESNGSLSGSSHDDFVKQ